MTVNRYLTIDGVSTESYGLQMLQDSEPYIPAPVTMRTVEIAGSSRHVDATDFATGHPEYSPVTDEHAEFLVRPASVGLDNTRDNRISLVLAFIREVHGQRCEIVDSWHPLHTLECRCQVAVDEHSNWETLSLTWTRQAVRRMADGTAELAGPWEQADFDAETAVGPLAAEPTGFDYEKAGWSYETAVEPPMQYGGGSAPVFVYDGEEREWTGPYVAASYEDMVAAVNAEHTGQKAGVELVYNSSTGKWNGGLSTFASPLVAKVMWATDGSRHVAYVAYFGMEPYTYVETESDPTAVYAYGDADYDYSLFAMCARGDDLGADFELGGYGANYMYPAEDAVVAFGESPSVTVDDYEIEQIDDAWYAVINIARLHPMRVTGATLDTSEVHYPSCWSVTVGDFYALVKFEPTGIVRRPAGPVPPVTVGYAPCFADNVTLEVSHSGLNAYSGAHGGSVEYMLCYLVPSYHWELVDGERAANVTGIERIGGADNVAGVLLSEYDGATSQFVKNGVLYVSIGASDAPTRPHVAIVFLNEPVFMPELFHASYSDLALSETIDSDTGYPSALSAEVTHPCAVTLGGRVVSLEEGEWTTDLLMERGDNEVSIDVPATSAYDEDTGTVTDFTANLTWRRGDL